MSADKDSQNKRSGIVRSRWGTGGILFLLSIALTFWATGEINFVSIVKSLFIFVPSMLILRFAGAITSSLADYKKQRRWEDLLVVVLLAIGIGLFLLLIVLFLRSVVAGSR